MADIVGTPIPSTAPAIVGYGTVEAVAALAQTWTKDGLWMDAIGPVEGTTPTLTQVVNWLNTVSSMLDLTLAGAGFTVPIVAVGALSSANMFVESIVADLCNAANSSGRFLNYRVLEHGGVAIIYDQITKWVEKFADGLEAMGAIRTMISNIAFIGFRSDDDEERLFGVFTSGAISAPPDD
jgi:hypothetical protein